MSNYAKYKDLGGNDPNGSASNINTGSVPAQPVNQNIGVGTHSPMPSSVVEIQNLEHKKHLISNNRVCVVKIHADWCQPCKQIAPRYNQIANKYSGPGLCCLSQENSELGISNVRGVPTFQFFKEGRYLNNDIVGADISLVEKRIMELLQS